jgi:hypothetical protein
MIPLALELSGPCPKRPSPNRLLGYQGVNRHLNLGCSASARAVDRSADPRRMLPKGHSASHSITGTKHALCRPPLLRTIGIAITRSTGSARMHDPKGLNGNLGCTVWLQMPELIVRCRNGPVQNDRCDDQTSLDSNTPAHRTSPYFPAFFIASISPRDLRLNFESLPPLRKYHSQSERELLRN